MKLPEVEGWSHQNDVLGELWSLFSNQYYNWFLMCILLSFCELWSVVCYQYHKLLWGNLYRFIFIILLFPMRFQMSKKEKEVVIILIIIFIKKCVCIYIPVSHWRCSSTFKHLLCLLEIVCLYWWMYLSATWLESMFMFYYSCCLDWNTFLSIHKGMTR